MEKKKPVGIWVRVSMEDQAKGDSPEHHEMRARLYAEAKGWDVKEVYHLEALSGKSVMNYPQTKKMLEDIRKKKITGLIFSKLARLARNTRELLEFADIFKSEDSDLISLQEAIDTSTPAGRLFYTMIAAMAQWEREEISERVAASVPIRAKLGKPIGGQAPFGYRWLGKELVIDQHEGPVRKLMFELFAEHKRKKTVAKELNDKGHRTRKGSPFSDTTIGRLLRDPMAKGQRRSNYTKSLGEKKHWKLKPESDWILTPCPALIPEELWNRVNSILDQQDGENKRAPARKAVHLFAGVLYCQCGGKMYVPSRTTKYTCSVCKKIHISSDDLEEIFYEQLKKFLLTKDDLSTFLVRANEAIQSKESELQTQKVEKDRIKGDLDKLIQLHLKGQIPSDGFKSYYDPLDTQLKQILISITEIEAQLDFLRIQQLNGDHILENAESLYETWSTLDKEPKRQVVEELTESITIGDEEITIKFGYNPFLFQNPPSSQHNLIRALPFWKIDISFKNPYSLAFSAEIGDQIRRKRLYLGLLQEDVARLIKVSTDCITYWENKRSLPQIQYFPAIIKFLGYNPFTKTGDSIAINLQNYRIEHGLSHKKLGKKIGVDASTVSSWEKEKYKPDINIRKKIESVLAKEIGF